MFSKEDIGQYDYIRSFFQFYVYRIEETAREEIVLFHFAFVPLLGSIFELIPFQLFHTFRGTEYSRLFQ